MTGISILIEGLDGTGKTTLCRLLAEKINAKLIKTPPDLISGCRDHLVNERPECRAGYYMVGNYISSKEIEAATVAGENVVIDRFFPSTRAYILGKDLSFDIDSFSEDWSPILIKPDYMFLLRLDNTVRIDRLRARGALNEEELLIRNNPVISDRINAIYLKFGCEAIDIDSSWSPERVVDEVLSRVTLQVM